MVSTMNATTYCISTEVLLRRTSGETSIYFHGFLYFYVGIGIISTIMNTLIVFVLIFSKELHGTFYIILSSLFVSDLTTGSIIFPMLAALNATFEHPDCTLLTSCQYFVHAISLASILSMMGIAYDRYLRVAKRHTYNIFMTKRKGYAIVVSIWLVSPILGVLNTFIFPKVIAITAICVLCLILYLYMITLKKLRTNVNQVSVNINVPTHVVSNDGGVRRSSRLVFILIFVMLLSWCPSIAISMMSDKVLYSTNEYFLTGLQQLPLLSAVSSPFLYFWTNRTTRRIFVTFCFKTFCKKVNRENNVTTLT